MHIETYLHCFCGEWGAAGLDLAEPYVVRPWDGSAASVRSPGWKVATDGRAVLAVPTDEAEWMPGGLVRRPRWQALSSVLQPCLEDWPTARPWPNYDQTGIYDDETHAAAEHKSVVVLDWETETVIDSQLYWRVEKLARTLGRQLEYRPAERDRAVHFRATETATDGRPRCIGAVMPICWWGPEFGPPRHTVAGIIAATKAARQARAEREEAGVKTGGQDD